MDLGKYNNSSFKPGASIIKRILWYVINAMVFDSWFFPQSRIKCTLLRLFGAEVGIGVNIKPRVNIKYPWNLKIGNNVWIGEGVWIDSLVKVSVGSNVCISQDAYILTGNHDYKDPFFGLIVSEVVLNDGTWVGAKSIVCPGSLMKANSILTVGSVLSGIAEENGIYRGNPATLVRTRVMRS